LLDHAAAGISAEHGWTVPQQRSADRHVSREAGGDQARRELSHVAAARAVRSDRYPAAGARNGSLRQLTHHRGRLRNGAELGAARTALPARRSLGGTAPAARRLGGVREHTRARVETAGGRRVLLAAP